MKNILVILSIILLCGCGSLKNHNQGVTGKASKAEEIQAGKIQSVNDNINSLNVTKLDYIGQYSYGINYALNNTNTSNNITIGLMLNDRIQSISTYPTLDKIKEMKNIVDVMTTNNANLLLKKDKEIQSLQDETRILLVQKDKEIKKYMVLADETASKADQYKATLNDLDSGWGFSAIWYGFKKLFTNFFWTFIILGVVYIVLRILSVSNPIAAAIFSIFNIIGSWIVSIIQMMTPKAMEIAGYISNNTYSLTKDTLKKLIDAIESKTTSTEIKEEVSRSMDTSHKDVVSEIKKELNY